tara:strand:- start:46692 stop:47723 length:1032 start_codon:yes stop_codon:yes gene_type:complete
MRIGNNPEKVNYEISSLAYHRVVVPVYIPNFEGYFKDAFEIFKLNIESLLLTVHDKTRITIYNNNCIAEVKQYIDVLYERHEIIDQVFHSKENLGKINAILASVKGNLEPLITITDSDVFFKHNWQQAVEEVFLHFPKAGMVSPVPGSKAYSNFTANNWLFGLFRYKGISFEKVNDPEAMKLFDMSLGNPTPMYKSIHLEKYLVLNNRGNKAVMGCGHFVATLKREVFDEGPNTPAFIKIQNGVENRFIDFPNEKLGYLRLATLNNYAYHLGNVSEKWMHEEFEKISIHKNNNYCLSNIDPIYAKPFSALEVFLGKVLKKVILHKFIKATFFAQKGLKNNLDY